MGFIRLERPVHYGNAGFAFTDERPADDPYIFKPEAMKDVWAAIHDITERYGYDFQGDEHGDLVLRARNNPSVTLDLAVADTGGQGTERIHPSAYAGTYLEFAGAVTSFSVPVRAARIDLVCPRAPGLGAWTYEVRDALTAVVVASGTIAPADPGAPAVGEGGFQFYDYRTTVDGSNATVATLYSGWFGDYEVRLSGAGAAPRLLDSLQLWHTDPMHPLLPGVLKTDGNAMAVDAAPVGDERRNLVIVVGRRRAVVTDSAKLNANPQNPEAEFVVAAAVDRHSVADPDAFNFEGGARESIIYDSGITDQDFAEYLARTFIYRYRNPRPAAPITHTFLPSVQLRDPVRAEEATFQTIDSQALLWVTGITHTIEGDKATTRLETTSFPEFPSYELREDIDIDAHFFGQPAINVDLTYTSLTGDAMTRVGQTLRPLVVDDACTVELANQTGTTISCAGQPWPPLPGTVFVRPGDAGALSGGLPVQKLATSPFHRFVTPGVPAGFAPPISIDGLRDIVEVWAIAWGKEGAGGAPPTMVSERWKLTNDKTTSRQWYWYRSATNLIRLVYIGDNRPYYHGPANSPDDWWSFEVYYTQDSAAASETGWLGNTPYHRFTEVDWGGQAIRVPWEQGDGGTDAAYAKDLTSIVGTYERPVDLRYRAFKPAGVTTVYPAGAPFYDAYTSELGYLVTLSFDALVSGLYRISVRAVADDTVIAWLTEPTGEAAKEEAHWSYFAAGAGKQLSWDGVDQVGDWNRRQSAAYASAAHGAFDVAERPVVGAGFYAWNNEERLVGGYPRMAVISDELDAEGKPLFGHGTYGEWYVRFEVQNDQLEERFEAAKDTLTGGATGADAVPNAVQVIQAGYPRKLDSGSATRQLRDLTGSPYLARVYTHLPRPTQLTMVVEDWAGGTVRPYKDAYAYEANSTSGWVFGGADADATLNNQKPLRVRWSAVDRPGVLWAGAERQKEQGFKLTRHVHLRVNVADQIVLYDGTNYTGTTDKGYPTVSPIEKRRIVNRKFTNDDHTLTWVDENWRTARSLWHGLDNPDGAQWVFTPSDFKKDFRGVPDEPLQFGDYLQLEELPAWDQERSVAGARSRFQIAFMSYLFYLDSYVLDRSGRMSWCLNTGFVDKSKICHNTEATTWPDDPHTQFRRTVQVRQWTNERVRGDDGIERLYPDHMIQRWAGGVEKPALRALAQHYWKDHDPTSDGVGAAGNARRTWASLGLYQDDYTHWHVHDGAGGMSYDDDPEVQMMPLAYIPALTRQLGRTQGGPATALGTWTWEVGPTFPVCVTRDFHGFYHVPPMPDKEADEVIRVLTPLPNGDYRQEAIYFQVDDRPYRDDGEPNTRNTGDDVAAGQLWNSPIHDDTHAYGDEKRFRPGLTVMPGKAPTQLVTADMLDYQRQDDLLHYEEIRGTYSRAARPQEAPRKLVPSSPYYQNPYRYYAIRVEPARDNGLFPKYRALVTGWFDFTFRREYLWESASFFPTNTWGRERLDGVNPWYSRVLPAAQIGSIRYDGGAWTGWKDDAPGATALQRVTLAGFQSPPNVFTTGYLPFAVGPRLPETVDLIFHLVLVNERRNVPAV
jgi:hypothetical protein